MDPFSVLKTFTSVFPFLTGHKKRTHSRACTHTPLPPPGPHSTIHSCCYLHRRAVLLTDFDTSGWHHLTTLGFGVCTCDCFKRWGLRNAWQQSHLSGSSCPRKSTASWKMGWLAVQTEAEGMTDFLLLAILKKNPDSWHKFVPLTVYLRPWSVTAHNVPKQGCLNSI